MPPRQPAHATESGAAGGAASESRKEFMAFLQKHCLMHLADLLLRNGFDELETLADMEDSDMQEIGIPAHESMRLQKSLGDLRGVSSQMDANHPVVAFLRDAGLQQYAEVLLRDGFDDMEALLEIGDADMRDLGLPRGHALKLSKRLRELREAARAEAPPCPDPVRPPPLGMGAALLPAAPVSSFSGAPPASCLGSAMGRGARAGPASRVGLQDARPTEAQSGAVERSWQRVQHLGSEVLGEKLYRHVFRMAPEVMALFPPEVRCKYREWSAEEGDSEEGDLMNSPALRKIWAKVINAVGVSVAGLRQPMQMVPMLQQLGARHISYGVIETRWWKVVGDALNCTLEECLGDEFTHEVRHAWTMVYGFISAVMIDGLKSAVALRDTSASDGWRGCGDDTSSLHSERSAARMHRSVSEVAEEGPQ